MKLGVVGGIAVLAGIVLVGCGAGIPQCNEDGVKDAVIEAFKQRERERIEQSLSFESERATAFDFDCSASVHVAKEYLDQEFRLVAVRTQEMKEGTRHCLAEVHGRKITFHNFCEDRPATLTDEVRSIERRDYVVFVDDDGYAHVR